jgi:hypothetical protein
MAMPMNANGQMPHGGSDSATPIPPPIANAAEAEKRGNEIDISERP